MTTEQADAANVDEKIATIEQESNSAPAASTVMPGPIPKSSLAAAIQATVEEELDPKIAIIRDRVAALLSGDGDARMSKKNYVAIMSAPFMTPSLLKEGAALLWQATKLVLEQPHPAIINVLWDFYAKHRDGLMSPEKGLRGIQTLSQDVNLKLSVVHTLFHSNAGVAWNIRKSANKPDVRRIIEILGDDRLYTYIVNKR